MENEAIKEQITSWLEDKNDYNKGLELLRQVCNNRNLINHLSRKDNAQHLDKINYELSKAMGVDYVPIAEFARKPVAMTSSKGGKAKPKAKAETPGLSGSKTEPVADPDPSASLAATDGDPEVGKRAVNDLDLSVTDPAELEEQKRLVASLPEDVQVVVNAKRQAYNQRNIISQWLVDNTKDGEELSDEAKTKTKEGLAIDEEIKALDSQLGYFWEHKTLPAAPKKPNGDNPPMTADQKEAKLAELEKKINNMKSQVTKAGNSLKTSPGNVKYQEKLAMKEAELKELRFQREGIKNAITG